MIATAIRSQIGRPTTRTTRRDREVEQPLRRPVDAGEDRRAQLEERDRLSRDVLGALREDLSGRRRDTDLHAALVRLLDELDELLVAHVATVHDQLVDSATFEHAPEVVERAEPRDRDAVLRRRDGADERVVDPAARVAERPEQVRDVVAPADEQGPAPHAEHVHQVAGQALVARAKDADDRGARDECGRREAVRPELMVDAPREDKSDHGDKHERRHDPSHTGAVLALGVEACLPEDEDRDQREERQPLLLRVPGHTPERELVLVVEPTEHEREVEPEREAADVDRQERRDRGEPAQERAERRSGEERGSRRADVRRDAGAVLLRRGLGVRRGGHEGRF